MSDPSFTRVSAALAAAALAAVLALAVAAPAAAGSGCAAAVTKDWRNARLHAKYAPECYRQALAELPEDIRIYSSAADDINRALIASLAKSATTKSKVGAVKGVVRTLAPTKSSNAARQEAARAAADPSASAVPITVLVFGAGALVLVATASASVVARRLRRSKSA